MGRLEKSKKQRAGGTSRSPTGRSTERTNARSTTSSAHLSDRSARLGRRPPPGRLSDRKAWPKTLLPTPTPRFRPETHRKPAYRSSPTGTASTDWSHSTRDSHSEGTRGERRKQRTKSKHGTGTIPCTPAGTVLHNRPDTSSMKGSDICVYSIVGTNIYVYNIVGTVGAPIRQKGPPHAFGHQ